MYKHSIMVISVIRYFRRIIKSKEIHNRLLSHAQWSQCIILLTKKKLISELKVAKHIYVVSAMLVYIISIRSINFFENMRE